MAYGNPSKLYVFEMPNGVIKAGLTSRWDDRKYQHERDVQMARHFVTDHYVTGFQAENELLRRLGRMGCIARGREWFTGIRFEVAVQLAKQIAGRFKNAKPEFKTHLLRKTAGKLSFNDPEIAVLDAYCARFNRTRSEACRELALDAIAERFGDQMSHAPSVAFF